MIFTSCLFLLTLTTFGVSISIRFFFKDGLVQVISSVLIAFSVIFFAIFLAFCDGIDADRYSSHLKQKAHLESILEDELPDGIRETVEKDLEYEKETILKYEKSMTTQAWEIFKSEKS